MTITAVVLNITGLSERDQQLLVGRRGENLAALQFMVNLLLGAKTDLWARVVVDVDGYRIRRKEALTMLAERMAERVMEQGTPYPLEPMSPYDRRIVHMALAEHPQVMTESTGEGDERRVGDHAPAVSVQAPGYVVVGHVAKDLRADGSVAAGGTALYSGLTAQHLACRRRWSRPWLPPTADSLRPPIAPACPTTSSPQTRPRPTHSSTPANTAVCICARGPRRSTPPTCLPPGAARRSSTSARLPPNSTPTAPWEPVFPIALIGVTPQGWMRAWGDQWRNTRRPGPAARAMLARCHVLVMSWEDAGGDAEVLMGYVALAPADGDDGGRLRAPQFTSTGAGWAGCPPSAPTRWTLRARAMCSRRPSWSATTRPATSVRADHFAHAAAAYAIEGPGTAALRPARRSRRGCG